VTHDRGPPGLGHAPLADLREVVIELGSIRAQWRASQGRLATSGPREFPSRDVMREVVQRLGEALFPMRLGPADLLHESEDYFVGNALYSAVSLLQQQVRLERLRGEMSREHSGGPAAAQATDDVIASFVGRLPSIRRMLDEDVLAALSGDPAARSVDEILLCYPGLQALLHHRVASELHRLGLPLLARIVSELAHAMTGIDIHPGARIGRGFFIDHGTGVVIGETCRIGDRVRIYQAVTLGAKRVQVQHDARTEPPVIRHPTIEDDVVIYAGATILGPVVIGRGSVIGGNVWLTQSVPPGTRVNQAVATRAPLQTEGEPAWASPAKQSHSQPEAAEGSNT